MKKPLSLLLCALLLTGLLPLIEPPARMLITTTIVATPNATTATVGDNFSWVVNPTPSTAVYHYLNGVYKDGVQIHQSSWFNGLNRWLNYRFLQPGVYKPKFTVRDMNSNEEVTVFGSEVTVDYTPTPVMTLAAPSSPLGTSLKVSWSPAEGAELYEVWRSTSRFNAYQLLRVTPSTYIYDTGLTPGTQYFYKIRSAVPEPLATRLAAMTIGIVTFPVSRYSDPMAGVPIGISNVTAFTGITKSRVTLSWNAAPGAAGYRIYQSKSPNSGYTLVRGTASTSLTVTGLESNTYYFFKIQPYRNFYPTVFDGPMSGFHAVRTLR